MKINKSGLIFGAIFFCAGLVAFYFMSARGLVSYIETASWQTTQGQLHKLELKHHQGETTTYSVQGKYSYYVDRQVYTGSRISIYGGSDNIGDYWQDLYNKLSRSRNSQELQVFYNPSKPSESVLDRHLRWSTLAFGSIFVLIFGGVGLGVMVASVEVERKPGAAISSNEKNKYWLLIYIGFVVLVMGLFISYYGLSSELRRGNYVALLMLLAPLGGFVALFFGFKSRNNYKYFGKTRLKLDPIQPQVGGQLGAHVSMLKSRSLEFSQSGLMATLRCLKKRRSGDDVKTSTEWKQRRPAMFEPGLKESQASFVFDLPMSAEPSCEMINGTGYEWEIRLETLNKMKDSARQLKRSWTIEVSESLAPQRSDIVMPETLMDNFEKQQTQIAQQSVSEQLPYAEDSRYITLSGGIARLFLMNLIGLACGLFFTWIGYFTISKDWWPGYLFLAVGLAILIVCICALGRSIEVKIDKAARLIHTVHRWFGIVYARHDIALFTPEQFKIKLHSRASDTNDEIGYYDLLIDKDGKKVKLVEYVKGEQIANALKAKLVEALF